MTAQLGNVRILVIDDDILVYDDIRKALQSQEGVRFQVEVAKQGEQGLDMIEEANETGRPYAMAFIDVRMVRDWGGAETVARLWNRSPDLRVVLCSDASSHTWLETVRTQGPADRMLTLKKPFGRFEVQQLADTLIPKPGAQRIAELEAANDQLKKEIAEHIRLQNQLRLTEKMEAAGQLAAGVAHDFNNLLTVVQGNASLMLTRTAPDSPDFQPLQNICAAAQKAAGMAGQLLTFCRKQTMQLRPTQLREILERLTETMPRVLTPAVKLHTQASPDLPLIGADRAMLETVLTNLAVNARDAMPNGGLLNIAAIPVTLGPAASSNPDARPGQFVRLSVTDIGQGIPPENLPRIFEPFFTTKTHGQGAGLGLAAVYGIVKQHQGWVEVQSKVQQGTAVHIYFPVLIPTEQRQTTALSAAPKTARETIFVVDDEPDLRELVVTVLESGGYKVLSAGSGVEALEKWAKRPGEVHLLLTDIVMPDGLTGRKLADQLRGEDPKLRVIFTSGFSAGRFGTELADVDSRSFLAKPYRPATLLRIVRECLDRQAA